MKTMFEHFEDDDKSADLHDSKVIYFLPNAQTRNPRKTE